MATRRSTHPHRGFSVRRSVALWAAGGTFLLALSGCGEHAYCFDECGDADASAPGNSNTGTGGLPSLHNDGDSGASASLRDSGGQSRVDGCTYEGEEICDGRDNDCDGEVDEDIDFTRPQNCGTCTLSCLALLKNVTIPICEPPDELDGQTPGRCTYEECAQDYHDFDPDVPGCEYYCDYNPEGTVTEDLGGDDGCGRDDDCDGQVDEDIDTCGDIDNCGRCGHSCVVIHATAECVTSAEDDEACDESNTQCVIRQCDDGYWDANGLVEDGCELECEPDGPEVCDGKDNDCDGLVDNTDPDLDQAPDLGEACQGGALGICGDEDHTGVSKCIGGQIRCCDALSDDLSATNPELPEHGLRNGLCESEEGPQVVRPGELTESCNGLDDDCDGAVDDSPSEVGEPCGTNVGTCTVGIVACDTDPDSPTFGTIDCVGATPPSEEICNGADDDCDGVIDGSALTPTVACTQDDQCTHGGRCLPRDVGDPVCALPTSDSGTGCQVPPAVPPGTTSACQAGTSVCRGGVLSCDGAITRDPGTPDTCGVDQNCDGAVDNTDLSLVETCGSCSNDCTGKGPNAVWTCESDGADSYECVQNGCAPNWYECAADDGTVCETYCQPTGTEVCNGVDDDCDCEIDEEITADPRSACGVRSMVHSGCDPSVACVNGAYQCIFSDPDICGGAAADCAGTLDDTCDGKDNDCDGVIDNLFVDQKGLPCTSAFGHCTEAGIQVCDPSTDQLVCNAPTPESQTETCNGVDDDCDGYVDEVATGAGAEDGEYVRPAVVALGSSGPWVFAYEASRPDATAARQGSGNGYFEAAPPGEALDGTIACSEPDRLPWTNVSPWEVEQTCEAIGGRVCRKNEWQSVCSGPSGLCDYGFLGCQSDSDYAGGPFCNLGAYDGAEDTLLPSASPDLLQCAALWADVYSNDLDEYDITGNAREIARCQKDRAVCTTCAQDCCAGAFSNVSGPEGAQQLCGNVSRRRLSGQPCASYRDCCNDDVLCNGNGSCTDGICRNDGAATTCVARGIVCTDGDDDGNCDQYGGDDVGCCDDAPLSGGVCGGSSSLPHAIYPLLGGSFRTLAESSAMCDYSFFKVDWDFRLFDTGFRCCFDADPR